MKKILFLSLFLLFLMGCASNILSKVERNKLYADYIQTNKLVAQDNITAFKFSGWRSLSNDYLIIRTSPQRRYLIELRDTCIDLSFSQGISIEQFGSRLRPKFDSISPLDFPEQKCFKSIYKVTREQANEMAKLGKQQENTDVAVL